MLPENHIKVKTHAILFVREKDYPEDLIADSDMKILEAVGEAQLHCSKHASFIC